MKPSKTEKKKTKEFIIEYGTRNNQIKERQGVVGGNTRENKKVRKFCCHFQGIKELSRKANGTIVTTQKYKVSN